MNAISEALAQHDREGTRRSLASSRGLIDFSNNDYLGLSRSPNVRRKLLRAIENGCPLGATGSRLLSGQTETHEAVECDIAALYGAPSALLFSSGYSANLSVVSALATIGAEFFSDQDNHASLIDGLRLSRAAKHVYQHVDLNDLEDRLRRSRARVKVIVSESLFSMSGRIADVERLGALAAAYDAYLVVDEAHATGVCGLGLAHYDERHISIHTGGKALGGQGAFVLSSRDVRDLMINRARSFIYSTALSPLCALQLKFALEEIVSRPLGGEVLLRAKKFREHLQSAGLLAYGDAQIVPMIFGTNERVVRASTLLKERGFDARAIRSPTVAAGTERLRVTIKISNDETQLEDFARALIEVST